MSAVRLSPHYYAHELEKSLHEQLEHGYEHSFIMLVFSSGTQSPDPETPTVALP